VLVVEIVVKTYMTSLFPIGYGLVFGAMMEASFVMIASVIELTNYSNLNGE